MQNCFSRKQFIGKFVLQNYETKYEQNCLTFKRQNKCQQILNLGCYEAALLQLNKNDEVSPNNSRQQPQCKHPCTPGIPAQHPTTVRRTTHKPPNAQVMLDSLTVLPKIPPGIHGTQFLGSQLQDSVTCVNDSHRQRPDPTSGT